MDNRIYTSSKEDVRDAIRDFDFNEEIEASLNDKWVKGKLDFYTLSQHAEGVYSLVEYGDDFHKIRKLQPSKPVNPYEELEENGKYKVVGIDHISDAGFINITYKGISFCIGDWVSQKDFAGYVFDRKENGLAVISGYQGQCYHPSLGHAIGVRFKVEKEDK